MVVIRCNISIATDDETVLVSIRVPRDTSHDDLDTVMVAVVDAFASAEEMNGPQNDDAVLAESAHDEATYGFVLTRRYSDPEYPDRLKNALQEMAHPGASAPPGVTLH